MAAWNYGFGHWPLLLLPFSSHLECRIGGRRPQLTVTVLRMMDHSRQIKIQRLRMSPVNPWYRQQSCQPQLAFLKGVQLRGVPCEQGITRSAFFVACGGWRSISLTLWRAILIHDADVNNARSVTALFNMVLPPHKLSVKAKDDVVYWDCAKDWYFRCLWGLCQKKEVDPSPLHWSTRTAMYE